MREKMFDTKSSEERRYRSRRRLGVMGLDLFAAQYAKGIKRDTKEPIRWYVLKRVEFVRVGPSGFLIFSGTYCSSCRGKVGRIASL